MPKQVIEAGAVRVLGRLARAMPLGPRLSLGRALGRLAHRLVASRRRLAIDNAERALGCSNERAREIAAASFEHFGRVFIECISLPTTVRPREAQRFEIEGLEHLDRAHGLGRGVIICSAHFGNWELLAQHQALAGFPMDYIARPLDNPYLEASLTAWREVAGNRVLGKHGVLQDALASLRQKRCLGILIDQHVARRPRFFVDFFGLPAATTPALGLLAMRSRAPIVLAASYPKADGGYLIRYHRPLEVPDDLPKSAAVGRLTVLASQQIESWVRDRPELWLWSHDRWKSLPEADEEVLR